MKKIKLNNEVKKFVQKPVNGRGGFQSLLRNLQSKLDNTTDILYLSKDDVERITKYCVSFGDGGFQERLKWILDRIE